MPVLCINYMPFLSLYKAAIIILMNVTANMVCCRLILSTRLIQKGKMKPEAIYFNLTIIGF